MITIQATGPFADEAERDLARFLEHVEFITSASVGPILVTVESEDELTKFWI